MRTHTYDRVRKAMEGKPFTMSLTGRAIDDVMEAVNVGIDSHLEACFVPDFGDSYKHGSRKTTKGKAHTFTLECTVSPQSMPVLLRRLFESGIESSIFLAADILDSIYQDEE